jgi:hypothetical protein
MALNFILFSSWFYQNMMLCGYHVLMNPKFFLGKILKSDTMNPLHLNLTAIPWVQRTTQLQTMPVFVNVPAPKNCIRFSPHLPKSNHRACDLTAQSVR